ncbi:hypothetical protein SARC_06445 [Sphaeroforma arctica JP610]|uniref:Uncharacterized protein n=1 Tax=Sphaeroforma arctica JP610 TaxID=667725 RepID=A0A0L0FWM0_9EUKA|nr:hypothetical protein SARC_06445 [Sphaeroforma arctica JP610]KNC81217.1 hypothetical protein SARC_06445 [Sphaeroforma arctica JP610]|eukprot:XP_014155119.1 hypothetical protein SARC_06445 [Sphaeroforma arctica JP610]
MEANSEVDYEYNYEDDSSEPKVLKEDVSAATERLASVRVSPRSEAQDPSLPLDHEQSNVGDRLKNVGKFVAADVGKAITYERVEGSIRIRRQALPRTCTSVLPSMSE